MKKQNTKMLTALVAVSSFLVFAVPSSFVRVLAAPKSGQAIEAQNSKGKETGNANNQNQNGLSDEQRRDSNKKSTIKESKGQETAATHRSVVATFVQNLLTVADREGGIGEQVRVIAQQQNDSKTKVSEKLNAVEGRSKIKTFLIGSDYKNLGALRSEMVKTRNRVDQLKGLVERATIEEDKTILQNQITALEQEQTNISNFVTQNESKFSLFGWVAKLFNK